MRIYHDGWLAGTVHQSAVGIAAARQSHQRQMGALRHAATDFSLVNDLAQSNPAKLKEMQDLFTRVAIENHVLPIDDRSV